MNNVFCIPTHHVIPLSCWVDIESHVFALKMRIEFNKNAWLFLVIFLYSIYYVVKIPSFLSFSDRFEMYKTCVAKKFQIRSSITNMDDLAWLLIWNQNPHNNSWYIPDISLDIFRFQWIIHHTCKTYCILVYTYTVIIYCIKNKIYLTSNVVMHVKKTIFNGKTWNIDSRKCCCFSSECLIDHSWRYKLKQYLHRSSYSCGEC